jgi:hypothetical protein
MTKQQRFKPIFLMSTILVLGSCGAIAKECTSNIVSAVLHSEQFSDYKTARGLDLIEYHAGESFQLIESNIEPIENQVFYADQGYNFLVSFTYGWNEAQSCIIYFPVKAVEQTVIRIGSAASNGGCGD